LTAPALLESVTQMTLEEFLALPDPPSGHYELHRGELVLVPPPKKQHTRRQKQIERLVEPPTLEFGVVFTEMPFLPAPDYECWVADVALTAHKRWDAIEDYLAGAPDFMVEVLSPSQSANKLFDKERVCLENGCREFWVVNEKLKEVKVTTADFTTRTYRLDESIPLTFLPGVSIAVADIFA